MIRFRGAIIAALLLSVIVPQAWCSQERPNSHDRKWLSEIRLGILAHDVPIWSRSRAEGGIGFNSELIFVWPNLTKALIISVFAIPIGSDHPAFYTNNFSFYDVSVISWPTKVDAMLSKKTLPRLVKATCVVPTFK